MNIRPLVQLSVSLFALATSPAIASTDSKNAASVDTDGEQAVQAEARQPQDEIEDIVVTAQKREQSLQSVPIAITAVTAKELSSAGATGTRDLAALTPGLTFTNIGGTGTPSIRGVATRGQGPGDEPSVPVYIDGIYQSTSFSALFSFNSIERIEILKGPQGTLFGRNALGGAINIVTRQPSSETEAMADVSYGTSNEVQANVYASLPIAPTLAVNVAYHHDYREGFIPNVVTQEKMGQAESDGLRTKIFWQPGSSFDLTIGGSYMKNSDNTPYSGYPLNGNTIARQIDPNVVIPARGRTAVGPVFFKMRQYGTFAVGNLIFDSFKITATAGWLDTRSIFRSDSDITATDYAFAKGAYSDESTQAELRASSSGENKIDWLVGAFYFDAKSAYPIDRDGNLFMVRATPTGAMTALASFARSKAYALFGEATWHATDKLSFTGGVRYNSEDRTKDYMRSVTPSGALPRGTNYDFRLVDIIAPVPTNPSHAEKTYRNVTFRASAQYDVTESIHSFFTFSQGFKSGFFNASSAPPFLALEPEKVNNYEIGLKSDVSRKLRVNLTGFYLDYKNIQVSARSLLGITDVFNASAATNYGGEVQVELVPVSGLSVKSAVAYQHARYSSFPNAVAFFALTSTDAILTNPCTQGTGALIGGNRTASCNAVGKPLARTPDWTANVAVNYKFDVLGGIADFAITGYYSGNFIWDLYGTLPQSSYITVNANTSLGAHDERYRVTVYANNLFDEKYDTNRFQGAAGTSAIPARGRTIGVRLSGKF